MEGDDQGVGVPDEEDGPHFNWLTTSSKGGLCEEPTGEEKSRIGESGTVLPETAESSTVLDTRPSGEEDEAGSARANKWRDISQTSQS